MTEEPLPADLAAAFAVRAELAARRFAYAPVMGSTNDHAAVLAAAGAADGTTVIADRQTAGRGRRGRDWHSPPAVGLYVSVILRAPVVPHVTLQVGVAVAEAIRATVARPVMLKWPNDIVAPPPDLPSGGRGALRKVGGILTEALPTAAGPGAVVGIGVNVGTVDRPGALADTAVALEQIAGHPVERGPLCAEMLVRLDRWCRSSGPFDARVVLDRWRELSPSSRGMHVSWDGPRGRRHGVTAGIDGDGALLVRSPAGTERVVGGELTWGDRQDADVQSPEA